MASCVTDTHALIWYSDARRRKLGRRARQAFERAETGRAVIYLPTIVVAELLEQVRRGHIKLALPPRQWISALFALGGFIAADLSVEVVLAGHELYAIRERGDRLIAATAKALSLPLITRDQAIAAAGVDVVW